jgi:hypothetical protein
MIRNIDYSNIDWKTIPLEERNKMLKKANLLDDKGRPKTKLTMQIKMMVVREYYKPDEQRIIIK